MNQATKDMMAANRARKKARAAEVELIVGKPRLPSFEMGVMTPAALLKRHGPKLGVRMIAYLALMLALPEETVSAPEWTTEQLGLLPGEVDELMAAMRADGYVDGGGTVADANLERLYRGR
jgi:hypothetical protein